MAVKATEKDSKLLLEIDNGDFSKLQEAMKKWDFKDYQSVMRFMTSILVLNEDNFFSIKLDGEKQNIKPASHSIKE